MAHLIFIHGLANKPEEEVLLRQWVGALKGRDGLGLDLASAGVTHEMVYWANFLYPKPLEESEAGEVPEEDRLGEDRSSTSEQDPELEDWLEALSPADKKAAEAFRSGLEQRSEKAREEFAAEAIEAGDGQRAVPLPKSWEKKVMKAWVRDAHLYLYDKEHKPRPEGESFKIQAVLRGRLKEALERAQDKSGPVVLLSHSMGTMIAYDCFKHVNEFPKVDALVTIGSPLGLSEVQDGWGDEWQKDTAFPHPEVPERGWFNFYDRLDVVCGLDPKIANDYRLDGSKRIRDIRVRNSGAWRHSAVKYLARTRLRDTLRELLGV